MSEPPSGFGLPLYEASSPNLDIVAVHGIGADRDWTWSLHGTNWLGAPDMLPHDFPNARIMAYGYASNWLGKEAMSTSLEAVAGRFLSLVHELRKDCQGRNIMFIAHCFGGIVIEKTILKALANDSAQDRTLLAHISGLVFIGTPHRGSTSAGLANIVAAIAAFLNCGHKSSILKTANRDSQMLTDTVREFAKKALRLNLRIHCFYEEKETDIGPVVRSFIPATYKTMLVDRDSACLQGHGETALTLDHFKLNKFNSPEDPNYILVRRVMQEMQKPTCPQVDYSVIKCMEDLYVGEPEYQIRGIEQRWGEMPISSYEWITEDTRFQDWRINDGRRVLSIRGGMRTDRTMLMIGIARILSQSRGTPFAYFFCESGNGGNSVYILRSLIWSLVNACPTLGRYLHEYTNTGRRFVGDALEPYALISVLSNMLRDANTQTIYVLVDAVDKCDSGWDLFREFIEDTVSDQSSKAKWIISTCLATYVPRKQIEKIVELELKDSTLLFPLQTFKPCTLNEMVQGQTYCYRIQGFPPCRVEQARSILIPLLSDEEQGTFNSKIRLVTTCGDNDGCLTAILTTERAPYFLSYLDYNPLGDYQLCADGRSLNFDRHFFGFTQLYTPPQNKPINLDIITIASPNEHAYNCWRGDQNQIWPQDFLEKDLPHCRVLTYGYNSDLSTRGLSAVREYYSEFFDKLKMVRRTAEEAGRPLVLIGHGFGAAVVAKILMEAKDYEEDECLALASLYGSIKAMVLIAAPDSAMLIDQIQTMVAGDTTSPSPNLIAAIDDTVQGLAEDLHDFSMYIQGRKVVNLVAAQQEVGTNSLDGGDLWSTCDKFGKRQPSILKIPPFASTKIKVHKSMTSIARFGTSADPAYQSMVKILKEVEATAMTERSPEWINAAMIRKSGLTVIHNPPEAITDIVLIPDLTGDPWETWSQCSRNLTHYAILSKFWPASFLPKDFPETRILVWGFEPDPTFRMDAFLDRASELLHSLTMPDSRPLGRSMVFIAHSFGGILLKEMLRLADQGDTMATKDLMSYTSSVVFLGTPHGGDGDSLSLVDVVQRLIPSQYTQQEYDDRLERCQETFLTQRKTYGFRVKCFAEVPTSLFQSSGQSARYIIPKTAATLPESISTIEEIGAGSKGFCQFDDSSNAGYLKITLELQIALEQVKNDGLHLRDDCLKSLYFEQLQSRELDIAIALDSTATWLFKHRDYVDWASWGVTHTEERRGLLWIRGKPGSGKSTLMKEALTQAKVAGRRSSFSVSAFFFSMRSNVQLQKSPLGLFRTLLYDLIKQDKALLTAFITEYKRKRATNPGPWTWHQTELQNFFRSVYLRDEFSRLRNAMIFIDALDESDREGHKEAYQVARELVFYFREITAGRRLKVCLASRHYPDIEVPDCPQISVENFNGDDIIHFLNTKLHGADEDPRIKALAKRIADKAQGVFLWVVLVVETLNMNIANHMTELGLYDVLDNLPGQLEDLFESLFTNKSSKHELRVAANIFQWILLAERPLEKDELRHALTIDLEDTKPMDSPRRWSLSKDCIQEEARKFLTSLRFYTRGLAQITLKQYREPESQLHSFAERRRAKRKHIKDSASESIRLEGEEERKKRAAGDRMATKLDQRTKPGPVEGKQDNKAATGEDASDNENGEGQHNSSSSPAPISLMSILTKPFEGITDVPLPFPPPRFLPQPQPRPTLDPPSVPAHVLDSEILYKPTFMGHSTWVPTPPTLPTLDSLNNNAAQPTVMPDAPQLPLIPQDNPYRPTILPSLPSPRPKRFPRIPVRGLLNLVHEEWSSVQFIHESVREFFLRGDGFAILECNGNSKSLAERHEILAEYCMVCIYQTPWDTFGERVFDEFPFVRYALKSLLYHVGEAERGGIVPQRVVQALFTTDGGVWATWQNAWKIKTCPDRPGRLEDLTGFSAFHFLCKKQMFLSASKLLDLGVDINIKDCLGRSALHYAVLDGAINTIRFLTSKHANTRIRDNEGETPLHLAAKGVDGEPAMVDLLEPLLGDGISLDDANVEGLTPLHLAAKWGRDDVVPILLRHGAQVDTGTGGGWTALHIAILFHKLNVARQLLEAGADANALTSQREAPIHIAAIDPDISYLRLLIRFGANINPMDNRGRAPIHLRILRNLGIGFLIASGANIEARTRLELQTPLHLAVSCQYPSRLAIEALLEAGADGNAVDVGRNTVLHYAAERLPAADVKRLLEKCKKPIKLSEPNRFQRTPLHNTAWREDLRVFRVLMDAGADLTKKDSSNATPVHYAKGKIDHDQYLRDFLLSKGYKRSLRYIESHLTVVYEASDTRL